MRYVDRPVRLVVVGEGTQRTVVERLAIQEGLADRVEFLGAANDETLLSLYAGALAVLYPPFDEDYGYVTIEAFLCAKPVLTAQDSGGTLEFVEDGINGRVLAAEPEPFGAAVNDLARDRAKASSLGDAGRERAKTITWDGVIQNLVG